MGGRVGGHRRLQWCGPTLPRRQPDRSQPEHRIRNSKPCAMVAGACPCRCTVRRALWCTARRASARPRLQVGAGAVVAFATGSLFYGCGQREAVGAVRASCGFARTQDEVKGCWLTLTAPALLPCSDGGGWAGALEGLLPSQQGPGAALGWAGRWVGVGGWVGG